MASRAGINPNSRLVTNAAPKEDHMLAITKLTPAAEGKDVNELLTLPEKKQAKYFDD